ncbi:hypothetical protein JCM1393_02920 [Clostridium carnis]
MKVIKKDGRLQEFEAKKIFTSLENAARDSETILNESDLKILVEDIKRTLENTRKDLSATSSYEVVGVVFEILKRDGFNNVLRAYIEHDK